MRDTVLHLGRWCRQLQSFWGRVFRFQNWPVRSTRNEQHISRPILKFERPTPIPAATYRFRDEAGRQGLRRHRDPRVSLASTGENATAEGGHPISLEAVRDCCDLFEIGERLAKPCRAAPIHGLGRPCYGVSLAVLSLFCSRLQSRTHLNRLGNTRSLRRGILQFELHHPLRNAVAGLFGLEGGAAQEGLNCHHRGRLT